MKIITTIFTIFILLSVSVFTVSNSSTSAESEQHSSNSTLKILQSDGDINELVKSELKQGRWELVMFWATYCPVCKRDFEKLAEFISDNPELPFTVVGVVVDGDEAKDKAMTQINQRNLNYTHLISDFSHSNKLYKAVTDKELLGVPSQLLFNKNNELVGFGSHAVDIDALEVMVFDE